MSNLIRGARLVPRPSGQADYNEAPVPGFAEGMSDAAAFAAPVPSSCADDVVTRAMHEADQIRSAAYAEGYQAGLQQAELEMRRSVSVLAEAAASVRSDVQASLRGAERDVIDLVMLVAQKIVHRELMTDPRLVEFAVRQALEATAEGTVTCIRVAHQDLGILKGRWNEMYGSDRVLANVEIVGDSAIQRGGCIVETRAGAVDGQIETKLAEIEAAFLEHYGSQA